MKGRVLMGKAVEKMKENSSGIIRTVVALVTITTVVVTSVLVGGITLGRMETRVQGVCDTVALLTDKQQRHEDIIDEMRREAAYQKGVVNTKLEEIEKNVNRTLEIVQQWEISYAEESQKED